MSKKIVLWLEDKNENDIHHSLTLWCQQHGMDLIKVDDLSFLAEELEIIKESKDSVIFGFIIDLLLSGPSNLSDFNINYKWNHLGDDGGLILIKEVLRSDKFIYQNIPILVLSVRANSVEKFKDFKKLVNIQKRDRFNKNWEKDIKKWIVSLYEKNQETS